MRKNKPTVAVIGEFFIDHIFSEFNQLPKLGEESFARRYRREVGGGAAITACGLAKLGVDVIVVGAIGQEESSWVIQRLASFGVNCSHLQIERSEPTGITVSVSTREDRAFFTYYGANSRLASILRDSSTVSLLSRARHVHFACALDGGKEAILLNAVRRSARTSIDVQSHSSWLTDPKSLNILRQCDIFFPNEREAAWISAETSPPEILLKLRAKGLRGVGLKLGGKGAALLWGSRQYLIDPLPVKTSETTGAGDSFNAGFIFAWLKGYPIRRRLIIANICGALSTRASGGVAGFPSLEELNEYERNWMEKQ